MRGKVTMVEMIEKQNYSEMEVFRLKKVETEYNKNKDKQKYMTEFLNENGTIKKNMFRKQRGALQSKRQHILTRVWVTL